MRTISFTWLPDWSTEQHRKAQLHQLVAMATQMKFQMIFLLDRLVSIFRWHPTQKRAVPQSLSSIKTMALFPQSYPRASLLPCEHFPKACFGHALLGLLWGSISLEGPQSERGWRNLLSSSLHQFPTQIHSSFNFVPCHQLMCSSLSSITISPGKFLRQWFQTLEWARITWRIITMLPSEPTQRFWYS